jgi:hypothetical protein
MLDNFIDDLRNLTKVDDFTTGNLKNMGKLNEIIAVANGVIKAAERAAEAGSFKTFDGYIVDDGVSTLYELVGKPKA